MKNNIDARAAYWVAHEDRGPLSAEQVAALDAWLNEDVRHRGAYARAHAVSLRYDRARALDRQTAPAETTRLTARRRSHWRPLAAAAAVLLLAGPFAMRFFATDAYETRLGQVLRMPLEDGSIVTLNSNSRIEVRFDDRIRNVRLLRGEAIFDVAKDRAHPFVVTAGGTEVTAVGTSFRVRRLAGATDVLVREGIVEVAEASAPKPLRLVANTKTEVRPGARAVVAPTRVGEINRELAWRDGKIAFSGETLQRVAVEFSRYSRTPIRIPDPEVAKLRVVGLYSATDPVGFARAAAHTMDLEAVESDDGVLLQKKPPEILPHADGGNAAPAHQVPGDG